jgi:hypothetical protein
VNPPRTSSFVALVALVALPACGHGGGGGDHPGPGGSGSAVAPLGSAVTSAAAPPASGSAVAPPAAVPAEPPPGVVPPSSFLGAKTEKACRAQTVELASYQTRGDIALAGHAESVAAAWRVRLAGKPQEQIAFGSYDKESHPLARARAVGLTIHEAAPRVFATGNEWVVVWFDDKGLTYARPKVEPLPPPEIGHLGAVGPEAAADVALAPWPEGGALAAAPFGDKAHLGIFLVASGESGATAVKVLGVSHHGKQPHHAAVAAGAAGTFFAWDEAGALVGSRFDPAGKEIAAACTIAPASAAPRERLALAATASGAVAMWMEGGAVRTRALDASACPASPIWTVAEGKWASIAPLGDTPLVAWVAKDGRLLAARLAATGAPPARGFDAAEGTSGAKDAPAVVTFGSRAAFGWSEVMGPVISTKRLQMRIVDAACIPE